MRKVFLSGNALTARAALDARCLVYPAYPITPSSDMMTDGKHGIAITFPRDGRVFRQMRSEIGAIQFALGASASGKKAMTNTSGPGFALKSESIGYACMAEIPLVIVDVMRGGPATGLPTRVSQGDVLFARNLTPGDVRMIVLAPGTLTECYIEMIRAFNLAERFMQPVIFLSDETLGHMEGDAEIPDLDDVKRSLTSRRVNTRSDYKPYGVAPDEPAILNPFFTGSPYHITGLFHDEAGLPTEDFGKCQALLDRHFLKINAHLDEIERYEAHLLDDAEYLIICYGSVSLSAKTAIRTMRKKGMKVGMFRPITLWPSPEKRLRELSKRFDQENILVVEMNQGQYLREVERAMKNNPKFFGKANGRPISPKEIVEKMRRIHHES